MSQRPDLIKKIQRLLAKTVENGCTEAEAIAAMELVAKLMEQYDLTFKDVEKEIREERFKLDRRPYGHRGPSGRAHFPAAWHCMMAIAEFFACETFYEGTDIIFFGTEDNTDLAHAELAMLVGAVRQETDAYLARTKANGHGRTLRASFEHGMTGDLSKRLRALLKARTEADKTAHEALMTEPTAAGSGAAFHAPVVVTMQMVVQEKFAELGIKLTNRSTSRSTGSHSAYKAGQAAAARVSLGARRGLIK